MYSLDVLGINILLPQIIFTIMVLFKCSKHSCAELSHICHFATPRTVIYQAPLSMEFSR